MKTLLKVIIIVSSWFLVLSANTIRVPEDQSSIQAGINAAVNGDTVLMKDSTYYENINFMGKAITVASYMIIDNDTTHRDSTIINGSQPVNPDLGSVVSFVSHEDTTSVLYGFTITGGSGWWNLASGFREGGGIYCYYAGCKIIANKIINNSVAGPSALGGGLAASPLGNSACVVLKENQIAHNTVTANSSGALGGGLLLSCNAKLTANLISYNSCIAGPNGVYAEGGGISLQPGEPLYYREMIMENNTISHNSLSSYGYNIPSGYAAAWGGGIGLHRCSGRMIKNEVCYNEIWNYSSTGVTAIGVGVQDSPDSFLVDGNIIRDNVYQQATGNCFGGGLGVFGTGTILVINNLIKGNHATHGGGMEISNNITSPGTALLVNNTIVNNTATYGGGIYVYDANGYVMNTIVWGNQAATNAGIHIESGSSIQVAYSDVQGGWTGTGNVNLDPQFEPGDTLYHLSSTSHCINAGIDSLLMGGLMCYCPPDDYEGDERPYMGRLPDMGADETQIPPPPGGIEPQPVAGIPRSYALFQNYPNPFNPTTNIEFSLPNTDFVTLKVYDITGREVATLVSEKLPAGKYKYDWDASNLASGVYFYKLEAGQFTRVRKMVLVR
jgi:hypothetical protein